MKTFKDLVFNLHPIGNGFQAVENFSNGYGVSVVKFDGSYGFQSDLWEVAVLKDGDICYSTEMTDDVIGHQTDEDVTNVMKKLQQLDK
jgi:hypothetical protein